MCDSAVASAICAMCSQMQCSGSAQASLHLLRQRTNIGAASAQAVVLAVVLIVFVVIYLRFFGGRRAE